MLSKVMFAVDGSVPSREAAALAHGLLPKATEVLILQVVPQLPYGWISWPWPAFPNSGEDLAQASTYVSEVGKALRAQGWNVSTDVHFSVLSAGEMDQEILKLAETLGADLICLALERASVTARIVREAPVSVLVAKRSSPDVGPAGRRVKIREYLEPVPVASLLLSPLGP